ncbi:MAG: YlzJ-like family protein [Syntrophaceticus sp.]
MILYTPLPLELVMSAEDTPSPYQEIELDGVTLVVQPTAAGMGKIVQIRSTDPGVYLRPEFQPGQQVSLSQFQS